MTDQALSPADDRSGRRDAASDNPLVIQCRVLYALVLHDIKTRFFGSGWGYFIALAWPTTHLSILVTLHAFNLIGGYFGDSVILYSASGVLPFIAWLYMARYIMHGIANNKSFMQYPLINAVDVAFARIFLEFMTIFVITVLLCVLMIFLQIDVMPRDPAQAALGLLSACLVGIGFGVFFGVISMLTPLIGTFFMVFIVGAHLTSGAMLPIENLPPQITNILWYNPLLHSIEWIRVSYWQDYPSHLLNKTYAIGSGVGLLALGLGLERMIRKVTRKRR